ncbi:MAG: hypothetical protein FIA97_13050 [Methylococcaceae bacterium]|nr:hypothetical protein [Methylococcaceae bacterium]
MNVRKLSAVAVTALGLAWTGAAGAAQTPNYYECAGKNANLTLIVGSKAEVGILPPQTTLNLELGKKSYSFSEGDIETERTRIGDLKEVTLEHIPDLHIKFASVVIPEVSLGDGPVSFKSQLILTTLNTPFSPIPFEGVVNPSRYIDLNCTASLVYF